MGKINYTIGDLFLEVGNLIKKYEYSLNIQNEKKETNPMYSINEVISIYPQLSKHIITKYISDGILPVTRIGNHRYFYKLDIENVLKSKIEQINVTNQLNSWRNNK